MAAAQCGSRSAIKSRSDSAAGQQPPGAPVGRGTAGVAASRVDAVAGLNEDSGRAVAGMTEGLLGGWWEFVSSALHVPSQQGRHTQGNVSAGLTAAMRTPRGTPLPKLRIPDRTRTDDLSGIATRPPPICAARRRRTQRLRGCGRKY